MDNQEVLVEEHLEVIQNLEQVEVEILPQLLYLKEIMEEIRELVVVAPFMIVLEEEVLEV
tara:strand:+ start:267 stop:446 length:180 start_codon:yes stop_codon:yes gene_type:complete